MNVAVALLSMQAQKALGFALLQTILKLSKF